MSASIPTKTHAALKPSRYAEIATRLHALGMQDWTHTVLTWLNRFNGLDCCYFDDVETSPEEQVLQVLAADHPPCDEELAAALSGLDFLCWRVADCETGLRWDSRETTLQDFFAEHQPPNCWIWHTPWPSAELIRDWLLAHHHAGHGVPSAS